jgi:porin
MNPMMSQTIPQYRLFSLLSSSLFLFISSCLIDQRVGVADDALGDLLKKYAPQSELGTSGKVLLQKGEEEIDLKNPVQTVKKAKPERSPASVTKAKPARINPVKARPTPDVKVAPVAVPTSPEVPASIPPGEPEEALGLLGDWGGAKSALKKQGVNFVLAYKSDYVSNLSGGIEKKSAYLDNFDAWGEFDLEKILGVKGLSLVLYGLGNRGGDPSSFVGDSFVTSSIESPNTFKLYEAYLKQNVDDRMSVLFGLRDLNADFNSAESTKPFINSTFGISQAISQTGSNGPSIFPTTALALSLKYESPSSFYFASALFNAKAGDPERPTGTQVDTAMNEGALMIWEAGFSKSESDHPFKYGAGAWTYTKNGDAIDSEKGTAKNSGFYLLGDQMLIKHVSVFAKFATASSLINTFDAAAETGIVYRDLLGVFPGDALVFGYARGWASSDYQSLNDSTGMESVAEVAYRMEFSHGISVTPDFQYVTHPGLSKDLQNAKVGTLRLEISF